MSKSVQIPADLWEAIVAYFSARKMDDDELWRLSCAIKEGIAVKLEAQDKRAAYSRYKSAESPQEREAARQAYLDEAGIHPDWRWGPDGPDAP